MKRMEDVFSSLPALEPGSVWLAGAGPGDPGLLSVLALHGLRQADAIVYDALVDERILALGRPGVRLEYAGKRGGIPSARQRDISLRLIELARLQQEHPAAAPCLYAEDGRLFMDCQDGVRLLIGGVLIDGAAVDGRGFHERFGTQPWRFNFTAQDQGTCS